MTFCGSWCVIALLAHGPIFVCLVLPGTRGGLAQTRIRLRSLISETAALARASLGREPATVKGVARSLAPLPRAGTFIRTERTAQEYNGGDNKLT
eukprot:1187025-Prorocentrum_minimum.AAC.1